MRRAIRKLAYPVLRRRAEEATRTGELETYEAKRKEREEQEARDAAKLRRAVIRVFPDSGAVKAAVILDVQERTLRTFVGDELPTFTRELAAYDVLVGLNPRETLHALGIEAGRQKLIDLKPPRKTRQLNRSGRKLTITTEDADLRDGRDLTGARRQEKDGRVPGRRRHGEAHPPAG